MHVDRLSRIRLIEPLLLFSVFYLPGYLFTGTSLTVGTLTDIVFNLSYVVTSIPQILLVVYLVLTYDPGHSGDYGFDAFHPRSLLQIIGTLIALVAVASATSGAAAKLGLPENQFLQSDTVDPESLRVLPLVFLTSAVTGYREEVFFRSYCVTRFEQAGAPKAAAVGTSALMFAAGHVYQGAAAFVGALLMALLLSWVFDRVKNVHVVAVAHALYNFAVLIFVMWGPYVGTVAFTGTT